METLRRKRNIRKWGNKKQKWMNRMMRWTGWGLKWNEKNKVYSMKEGKEEKEGEKRRKIDKKKIIGRNGREVPFVRHIYWEIFTITDNSFSGFVNICW